MGPDRLLQGRVTVTSRAPHHPLPAMFSMRFRMDLNGVMRRKTPAPPGAVESSGFAEGIGASAVQQSKNDYKPPPPRQTRQASIAHTNGLRVLRRSLARYGPRLGLCPGLELFGLAVFACHLKRHAARAGRLDRASRPLYHTIPYYTDTKYKRYQKNLDLRTQDLRMSRRSPCCTTPVSESPRRRAARRICVCPR